MQRVALYSSQILLKPIHSLLTRLLRRLNLDLIVWERPDRKLEHTLALEAEGAKRRLTPCEQPG